MLRIVYVGPPLLKPYKPNPIPIQVLPARAAGLWTDGLWTDGLCLAALAVGSGMRAGVVGRVVVTSVDVITAYRSDRRCWFEAADSCCQLNRGQQLPFTFVPAHHLHARLLHLLHAHLLTPPPTAPPDAEALTAAAVSALCFGPQIDGKIDHLVFQYDLLPRLFAVQPGAVSPNQQSKRSVRPSPPLCSLLVLFSSACAARASGSAVAAAAAAANTTPPPARRGRRRRRWRGSRQPSKATSTSRTRRAVLPSGQVGGQNPSN